MTAIIHQPAGIGDIFFCLKIARKLQQQGYSILWPVKSQFLYLNEYISGIEFCRDIEHYPHRLDVLSSSDIVTRISNTLIVRPGIADRHFPHMSVMEAKYHAIDAKYDDWSSYFLFNRNKERENHLFYDILGLEDTSRYVLANRNFGSPPDSVECVHMKHLNQACFDIPLYEMRNIEGINLFDWCKVLEHAEQIHTAETSLNFIIEVINTRGELHMYSKWSPPNYFHIKNLFKAPWIYH